MCNAAELLGDPCILGIGTNILTLTRRMQAKFFVIQFFLPNFPDNWYNTLERWEIALPVRGCSQIMSAENGEGVKTFPPPFVSNCQHFPNTPSLFVSQCQLFHNPPFPLRQLCQNLPNPKPIYRFSFVKIFKTVFRCLSPFKIGTHTSLEQSVWADLSWNPFRQRRASRAD